MHKHVQATLNFLNSPFTNTTELLSPEPSASAGHERGQMSLFFLFNGKSQAPLSTFYFTCTPSSTLMALS
jgi:hypothetical protein